MLAGYRYGLTVKTAPTVEPCSLAEMKLHLRVDHADEDALIQSLAQASREAIELWTGRQFITATYELRLDEFPDVIELPRPPLQSVTSPIVYVDENGASQNLTSASYQVDIYNIVGQIMPVYGTSWPSTRGQPNAVTVTYVAGYGATGASVPSRIMAAIKMLTADLYEHRESQAEQRLEKNETLLRLIWSLKVPEIY